MGNFAENLNLGNRVRPPWLVVLIQDCKVRFPTSTDIVCVRNEA